MGLDKPKSIDVISCQPAAGFVVLTIADAWDWSDRDSHLKALQEKLNNYFAFIESGEILESYPLVSGKPIVIDIIGRFPIPNNTAEFFRAAADAASLLKVEIRLKHYPDKSVELT